MNKPKSEYSRVVFRDSESPNAGIFVNIELNGQQLTILREVEVVVPQWCLDVCDADPSNKIVYDVIGSATKEEFDSALTLSKKCVLDYEQYQQVEREDAQWQQMLYLG